ncbi:MAG: hypothetical protein M3044_15780 [Thermoproteota archaeon]|nr:hypothetical protein [Thermoproteota archaeon]
MSQSETEQERKVREYWARAYDNDKNKSLPYEPTAVLTKAPPNQPRKGSSIYNISSLDFTSTQPRALYYGKKVYLCECSFIK